MYLLYIHFKKKTVVREYVFSPYLLNKLEIYINQIIISLKIDSPNNEHIL